MLNLLSTDKIEVARTATAAVDCHADHVDATAATGAVASPGIGRSNAAFASIATGDLVVAPAAGIVRNVRSINIRNKGAAANNITVIFNQGGTQYELWAGTLDPGEVLRYEDGLGWFVVETQPAKLYGSVADQAIGASVTNYLVGSGINLSQLGRPLSAGMQIKWEIILAKTAASIAALLGDVRFGTAGTTADTARGTQFTTGVQTAVADKGRLVVTATVRTVGAAGNLNIAWALEHGLASTGLAPTPNVVMESTTANFDLTVPNLIAGISFTTGAAHAITVTQVVPSVDPD
jgi:hypothetical protein